MSPSLDDHLTVRYADGGPSLTVSVIHAWGREDVQPISGSSGLKDYLKNQIWTLFDANPEIDRIVMVRGNASPFLLLRSKNRWYDVTDKPVVGDKL